LALGSWSLDVTPKIATFGRPGLRMSALSRSAIVGPSQSTERWGWRGWQRTRRCCSCQVEMRLWDFQAPVTHDLVERLLDNVCHVLSPRSGRSPGGRSPGQTRPAVDPVHSCGRRPSERLRLSTDDPKTACTTHQAIKQPPATA
jgi:hypothetical protein